MIKMPSGATINVQLNELTRYIRVSYFRGVFMRLHVFDEQREPKRKRSWIWTMRRYSLDSVHEKEQPRRVLW